MLAAASPLGAPAPSRHRRAKLARGAGKVPACPGSDAAAGRDRRLFRENGNGRDDLSYF